MASLASDPVTAKAVAGNIYSQTGDYQICVTILHLASPTLCLKRQRSETHGFAKLE